MIRDFHIQRFRGLRDFRMHDLGRVNLLVGTNNCGKSSMLEGLEILSSQGNLRTILNATYRRGERIWVEDDTRRYVEGDISHLFYGHKFEVGSNISIQSESAEGTSGIEIDVVPREFDTPNLFPESESVGLSEPLDLRVAWRNGGPEKVVPFPLSQRGGISSRQMSRLSSDTADTPPVQFVSTSALAIEEVMALFDEVVLTPEEDLLVEALQTIEPEIERIAAIGGDRPRASSFGRQGRIVVKLKGFSERIPIGSMGDGIWRMLGIAIALVNAENGVLLVDEIDTGLHYSVLSDMWRLVQKTADRLNVQVFATSHSRDCYESLAAISRDNVSEESQVTIQRIDNNSDTSVAFTEQEIVAASQRGIEVR